MLRTRQELKSNKYFQGVNSKLILSGGTSMANFTGDTSTYKNVGFDVRNLSFIINDGFNSSVNGLLVQADDKIVVAGAFSTYQNISSYRITRLNIDGSFDTAFTNNMGSGFNLAINDVKIDDNNKFLVCGQFTLFNGDSRPRLVRLNSDGTFDPTFKIGTGFNNHTTSVLIQPDDKIIVIGSFTQYTGSTQNRIIRLNTDGSKDTSFAIGSGFNNTLQSIERQSDGKLIIGGSFTQYTGSTQNRIIRLNTDGSKDTSFAIGSGFNSGTVNAIKLQSNGKIIVIGSFTSYSGVTCNRIVRLHPNGVVDATFNVGGTGFNSGSGLALHIDNEDKIIIGGSFTQYNGIARNSLVRLNADGTLDTSFVVGDGFDNNVIVAIRNDDKYLIGGSFTSYKGKLINRFIQLNIDGSADATDSNITIKNGIANYDSYYSASKLSTNSLTPKSYVDEYIKASNGLTKVNDTIKLGGTVIEPVNLTGDDTLTISQPLITLSNKGGDGSSLNFYSEYFSESVVTDINIQGTQYISNYSGIMEFNSTTKNFNKYVVRSNGAVHRMYYAASIGRHYFGGDFTLLKSNTGSETLINKFGRFVNGSIDSNFRIGNGFTGSVYEIVGYTGDTMLVGGNFTQYSGVTANKIVLLMEGNASIVSSFTTGAFDTSATIYTIKPQLDGKILVGGNFTEYSGVTANNILRLNSDGTIDETFISGNGFDGDVNRIDLQPDGKILVGGFFTEYDFNVSPGIVRLNSDGSYDNTFVNGGFDLQAITMIQYMTDDTILVGGFFTSYSGVTLPSLIKLNIDGSIYLPFSANTGTGLVDTTGQVEVKRVIDLGANFFIGGQFSTWNDQYAKGLATFSSDGILIKNTSDKLIVSGKMSYSTDESARYNARTIPDVHFVTGLTSSFEGIYITGATNGLTKTGNKIGLGGLLTGNTTINAGTFNFILTGSTSQLNLLRTIGSVNVRSRNSINLYGTSNAGIDRVQLKLSATGATFIDSRTGTTSTGIQYSANYSANFTSRSLVDKAYVTGVTTEDNDYIASIGDILFDRPRKYGYNGLAVSGNINVLFTGAFEKNEPKLLHNDMIKPTITSPTGTTITQIGTYVENVENEYYFKCHKNNAGVVKRITVFIYPNI